LGLPSGSITNSHNAPGPEGRTIGGLLPLLLERSFQAQFLIPMATALCFGLMLTTLLVLVLVPVMYSFFGTSAREEHEEEYAAGFAPQAGSSVEPDAAEQEWLPEHLRGDPARRETLRA
jgi:hypothetical protein